MAIDLNAVGRVTEPHPVRWTSREAILYALGVGSGADDPTEDLQFTTENTAGVPQKVLPTFSTVLAFAAPQLQFGDIESHMVVHAEEGLTVHEALQPDGKGSIVRKIDAIYDKGSGALVTWTTTLFAESGHRLADLSTGAFIRGAGGFNGIRGPKATWSVPERAPDLVVEQRTRADQALIYRLCGDHNPLHTDPQIALAAGWPRPILHGLCTYGFVGRVILGLVGDDPSRMRSYKVRFSSPVIPGETLSTSVWRDSTRVLFRTAVGDRVVLDAGQAEILL